LVYILQNGYFYTIFSQLESEFSSHFWSIFCKMAISIPFFPSLRANSQVILVYILQNGYFYTIFTPALEQILKLFLCSYSSFSDKTSSSSMFLFYRETLHQL